MWKGSRPCHGKNMTFGVREEAGWVFPIEADLIQALDMVYCCFENFPRLGGAKTGLSSSLARALVA